MRTIKNVSFGSSKKGENQFITKSAIRQPVNGEAEAASSKSGAAVVLGSRSNNSTTSNLTEVQVTENIAEQVEEAREAETAADPAPGGSGAAPAGTQVSDIIIQNMMAGSIEWILPSEPDQRRANLMLNKIYRDMYYHDAITGSAIDLMSTLPFSDFTMTGLKDEKVTKMFVESVESMSMGTFLPNVSVEYLTMGAMCASMTWDTTKKNFVGITPYNVDHMVLVPVPVYGIDPIIKIELQKELLELLGDEEAMKLYKQYIPKEIMDSRDQAGATTGKNKTQIANLDPSTTLFIPRRGLAKDYRGTSLLERALPAWFYEKALIKGTLDQVYKRQRATTHITAGDGQEWIPDAEEMGALANLFLSADLDPLGAVVVTRNAVNVNEVRRGDDFWRWDQNFDVLQTIKLRAVGVSEAFITGDANFNTVEQSLSVFLEQIRNYRQMVTAEVFYNKMFPKIAHENGITQRRYGKNTQRREVASYGSSFTGYDEDDQLFARPSMTRQRAFELAAGSAGQVSFNVSDYVIPEVQWHKRLLPEADADYINMLGTLEEKGVPIPIRHWIAAGGFKVEKLLESEEDDKRTRKQIADWRKEIVNINKSVNPEAAEGGEGGGGDEFANAIIAQRLGIGSVRPRAILSRGNPELAESQFSELDSQGHRRVMTKQGRDMKVNKYNKVVASAVAEVARMQNARDKADKPEADITYYHSK